MPKLRRDLLLISFFCCILFAKGYDISKGRYNPEVASMGGTGVAGFLVPNAIQLNPANIAHYNGWNNYWYGARFENELSHNDFTFSFQMFDVGVGLSYIYQTLGNIPNTRLINGRIRDNGSFSESINQVQFHTATKLTNLFLLKEVDLGASVGFQNYTFTNEQDLFFRVGSVFSFDLLPNVYFGVLMNDSSEVVPFNYGVQYRHSDYKLFLDSGDKGLSVGGEYTLNKNLFLRGGLDKDFISLGAGLFYDKLYFFGKEDMGIRFDYAFQIPIEKYPFEPQHLFGVTIREQEKLPVPFLYTYPPFTNKKSANVVGWSLPETNVQVFYRDILIDMVKVNRNGYWEAKLPLNMEVNDFYFKAIQKGPRKESLPSKKYRIIVDQIPPDFKFEAFVKNEVVTIDIYPSETLSQPPYLYEAKKATYFNKNKYSVETELKDVFSRFIATLKDNASNEANISIEEPFVKISSPIQSLVVTHKDKYQFVGSAGIYHNLSVENFRNKYKEEISLIGKRITIFKPIIPIEIGINKIQFCDKLDKGTVYYFYDIFRLFNYKDIADEDADLLATCYVLPRESLFEPLKRVRQHELIKWIVSLRQVDDVFSAKETTLDEAYNIALRTQWIRTREDMRYVSRGEVMDIISKAFGYVLSDKYAHNEYFRNIKKGHPHLKAINYFVEKGYLDVNNEFYDSEVFITREELLNWLKKSPYFMKLKKELRE